MKGSDSDKKNTDDAGNDGGEDEKSGDREGDDPTDGSLTLPLPAVSFDAQAKVYATTADTASPKVF